MPLPRIMVAPNGARRTKADHPALPMTTDEVVDTAAACFEAGAGGIHAHVRDADGHHVLDAGLYRELRAKMIDRVPGMQLQVTTEAVGRYTPAEQRQLVRDLQPSAVSIAIREMIPEDGDRDAEEFYRWGYGEGTEIQHIVYDEGDVRRFNHLVAKGVFPGRRHLLLFVLGRYTKGQESCPSDLDPLLKIREEIATDIDLDWAICAFGRRETDCLVHAAKLGGKARIGFENSLWNRDGSVAKDNADRVRDLVGALEDAAVIWPEG